MQQRQLVENHADYWRKNQQQGLKTWICVHLQNISHKFDVGFAKNRKNLKYAMAVNNGFLSFIGTQICKGAVTILPAPIEFFYGKKRVIFQNNIFETL